MLNQVNSKLTSPPSKIVLHSLDYNFDEWTNSVYVRNFRIHTKYKPNQNGFGNLYPILLKFAGLLSSNQFIFEKAFIFM